MFNKEHQFATAFPGLATASLAVGHDQHSQWF